MSQRREYLFERFITSVRGMAYFKIGLLVSIKGRQLLLRQQYNDCMRISQLYSPRITIADR